MKNEIKTYTPHDIEINGSILTVYVDDTTKKVHHGVFHESQEPRTLHPYEPNKRENVLDNCADMYTWQQMKRKIEHGTVTFQ